MDTNVGQLLESLPLAQRLLRYRQFSQEALRKATDSANGEIRAGYLSMAAGWHMLATEIERVTNRDAVGDEFSLQTNLSRTAIGFSPADRHKNGF